jgi:hypothetical protein
MNDIPKFLTDNNMSIEEFNYYLVCRIEQGFQDETYLILSKDIERFIQANAGSLS